MKNLIIPICAILLLSSCKKNACYTCRTYKQNPTSKIWVPVGDNYCGTDLEGHKKLMIGAGHRYEYCIELK